eukprot:6204694-Pleurochrysis_carterae.AAC.3
MLKRVAVGVGKALRDTGQAIERMGCRAQDNFIFNEPYCRHRAVMNLYDQRPRVAQGAFIAPNAAVIGNVDIEPRTSIWCVHNSPVHWLQLRGTCLHGALESQLAALQRPDFLVVDCEPDRLLRTDLHRCEARTTQQSITV